MGASVFARHFQIHKTDKEYYITFSRHVTVLGCAGTVFTFNTVEGKVHASFCREPFPHAPVASQQC